ncbi:MAG: iron chelate uptake ABC transporter family permease subunit [Lachnospiraceae bacterium]|nr:iron chelate uptake ABC transporter family permease subunit [Lachnospiraceae bacterium]
MKTTGNNNILLGYKNRQRQYLITVVILFLLVMILASVTMIYGNTVYSPDTVFRILLGEDLDGSFTIKTLRFPRMFTAVLCGFAFGLSGNTFQKLLGNPLASPDIIGVTSSASVAAVFSILILGLNGTIVSVLSVLCGLLVAGIIYAVSQSNGVSNERLILTGIGAQAFLNALISWLLLKASEYDVATALRWLNGSLNGVKMNDVPRLLLTVLISSVAIIALGRHLKVLQLGNAYATALGVRIKLIRLFLILFALLLVAFATSVSGPIASVAFLSGPIASRISGSGRNNNLSSGLIGSILVLISDLVGQYAFTTRFPVGIITGILGAPYLIFLLLRINHKGERVS